MRRFTSRRERRLWLWLSATLAVIYSTMGVTRQVAEWLRHRGLLESTLTIAAIATLGVIAWLVARRRPGRREVAVGVGFAFVCLWALARVPHPEERTHLIEYAVVAGLIYAALEERRRNGAPLRLPSWLATLAATFFLGWLDEGLQSLLPGRVYDLRDVGFNGLAALMAVTVAQGLAWARRRDRG